jgi:hypothetical protein
LCLRGLRNEEVVVLRRSVRGRVFSVPDLPPIEGLRAEQLLTSEYFGLSSTLDPDVEQKFNEFYRLLALRDPTERQRTRIAELKRELKPLDMPGTTRRERRLLEIIDKQLAVEELEPGDKRREEVTQATQRQIAADLGEALSSTSA